MSSTPVPPLLAITPSYGGTLAAVRSLGAVGIPITVAGSDLLDAARWSRYATRWLRCPPLSKLDLFVEWLMAFGAREPGHVLYPSDDEMAWVIATHANELRKHFRLFEPSATAIECLLDKKALHQLCCATGVDTVPSWFPEDADEVGQLAAELPYPVLIKPRSQAFLVSKTKGMIVGGPAQLMDQHRAFLKRARFLPGAQRFGKSVPPMLQQYFDEAPNGIYTLSGFVAGDRFLARAALKILQRPRRAGIGVCFEEAPLEPEPLEAVARLCRAIGYRGVFEVEFIRDGNRRMLIDFNPRFYGQMAFDIARGMSLALFAWHAACGNDAGLRDAMTRPDGNHVKAYCDRFYFRFLLTLQRLMRSLPGEEYGRWRRWYSTHREQCVDGFLQGEDLKPGVVHAVSALTAALTHPRSFLREYVLDSYR
jgi:D-aspartate ligase